jgi:hypothetical protein
MGDTNSGARPSGPGSREPDPQAVPALSGFDPSRGFRILGYATGSYFGKCATCAAEFIGDKRARTCLACAAIQADHLILTQRQEIEALRARRLGEDSLRDILWRHLGGDERYTAIRRCIDDILGLASGIEARSDETLQAAQPERREPVPSGDAQTTDPTPTKGR